MKQKIKKYGVLYVDDEYENLQGFKFVFRKNYKIYLAQSAEEGAEILTKNNIHLVITDQRMPRTTGIEFLEEVAYKYPDITRIILTGYSDVEAVIQAINKGQVYRYMTKPWEQNELKITIDNGLEAFELKRQNKLLIHNLTKSNQELEYSNQELDYFIYRSSHDLRRPLTTLMGLNEVAQVSVKDPFALQLFENVYTTVNTMDKMLNKLLMVREINKYNRNEATEIHFETIYQKVIENLNGVILETGVTPTADIKVPNPFKSSAPLITATIEYVLENAIYYSKLKNENPEVKLTATLDEYDLIIEMYDNGVGIPENIKPSIYDMYFRGSVASKGNGLGLYVVKKINEKLRGKIKLETKQNEFTKFTFRIPVN